MTAHDQQFGLLLAAHGERGGGASNDGVARLATVLAARNLAAQVGFGFIKGAPTIGEAVRALALCETLVYPLFLSDGWFSRVQLPRLLKETHRNGDRTIRILPPLGLDPALADLVAGKAMSAAQAYGFAAALTGIVLLAHGSARDRASQAAAEQLAAELGATKKFDSVAVAFLEQAPSLSDILSDMSGPVVVVGLFAGEGLHGKEDVSSLITAQRRSDIAFAGNVGAWPEIADVVAAAVGRREPVHA